MNHAITADPKPKIGWWILALLGYVPLVWGFVWAGEDVYKLRVVNLEPTLSAGNFQMALVVIGGTIMLIGMLRGSRS